MYIIDGYNLLWLINGTSSDFDELSSIQLCRLVNHFLKLQRQKGIIVFDGTEPAGNSSFNSSSNLEVIFAGGGKDADSLIEKKIEADSAPRRLIVVSSDRMIRKAAGARRAGAVKSERFWSELQLRLRQRKKVYEPAEKQEGLDEAQTSYWLKYFDLEQ